MFLRVHPGPGIFMLNRPEMSEAHHMFGPVGGTPPARAISSSDFRTEWNPEMEAKAIASSVVNTCSVAAVSPTAISSYVLLSINPRFIRIPSPLNRRPIYSLCVIVWPGSEDQSDCSHLGHRTAVFGMKDFFLSGENLCHEPPIKLF